MTLWKKTVNTKFLFMFLGLVATLLGTQLFYYSILMVSKENAQQVMDQRWKEMALAENVAESMQRAQEKWEEYIIFPKVAEYLVHDALANAEQLKERQQLSGNGDGVRLTEKVAEEIQAFWRTFQVAMTVWETRGLDESSGLIGAMRQTAHDLEQGLNNLDTIPSNRSQALYYYLTVRRHEKDYFNRKDDKYIHRAQDLLVRLRKGIDQWVSSLEDKKTLIDKIDLYEQALLRLVQQDLLMAEQTLAIQGRLSRVRDAGHRVMHHVKEDITKQSQEIWGDLAYRIRAGLFIAVMTSLLGLLIIGILVNRMIARPLMRLKQAAVAVNQGVWDWNVKVESTDEVGELANALNTMVRALQAQAAALAEANQIAEAASLSKSLFVANMSHEIRTPMNAILGLTHLCLHTATTPQQQDYLNKILRSANTLLNIINDILDFSKIEAGKLTVEAIPFNLSVVLSNLSTLIMMNTQEKDVEVIFSVARGVPRTLLGDPTRLGQILVNLTNNAVKFTHSGEIVLSIERTKASDDPVLLQFSIRDTGIGMNPEQINRLFQSFSQADSSTTRKYGGTGLGLTISKHLVEMMGGTLGVESVPGEGSVFIFSLPFGLPEEARRRILMLPEALQKKKVLVIDDNKTSREMLCTALESFSFQVTAVSAGMAGLLELEKAHHQGLPFELLLLDWHMAGLDGLQTFRCVKAMATLVNLPILFMAPHAKQAEIRFALGGGQPDAFLDKPVQISTLFDTVMTLFGKGSLLPLGDHGQQATSSLQPSEMVRGARVLLVEDNEINQQVGKELLEMAGVIVEIAHDGQEAVRRVQETAFELVLMDVQMPIMDGLQATRLIRTMPGRAQVPIVAMTANVMVQDLARCWDAGMDGHIAKPVDPNKLFRVLNQWIKPRKKEAAQQNPLVSKKDQKIGESPSLPAMTGINTELGLSCVGGKAFFYQSLLDKFLENHSHCIADIQTALQKGDSQLAHRIVHTLKGVAGTIGALRLQAMARELESNLLITPEFGEELDRVLDAIRRLQRPAAREGVLQVSKSSIIDRQALFHLLTRLKYPIEKRRPKQCQPILEQLERLTFPPEMQKQMDKLVKAIKTYQLKEALPLLDTLLASLHDPEGPKR